MMVRSIRAWFENRLPRSDSCTLTQRNLYILPTMAGWSFGVTLAVMLLAADPLANFIHNNPTVVMLALGFLLMIGAVLIADGFGVHVPKGYIYAAMAFSGLVEGLNMVARKSREKKAVADETKH